MNIYKDYLKEKRIALCGCTSSLKPLLREVNFKNRHANVTGCNKWSAFCSANMIGQPRHQSTQPAQKYWPIDTVSFLQSRLIALKSLCDLNQISQSNKALIMPFVCYIYIYMYFLHVFLFQSVKTRHAICRTVCAFLDMSASVTTNSLQCVDLDLNLF